MSSLRALMPATAAIVDDLRAMFGRDLVDQALRNGIALQREHEQRVERHGRAAADAWLDAQHPKGPTFAAIERDMTVGKLPGCAPAVISAARRGVR